MTTVIKVENIGKKYIIGHQREERYETLRDKFCHVSRSVYQQLRHPLSTNQEVINQEEFWALRDINFEVQQGDRVGIIGRNGAGKSTLLKILSRITQPTTGKVTILGRVASLLEVGTGFHPELSGRENIFLNGAVLGMRHREIKQKFDEIVAFAEVENFLDTPVKRYSSGMYVRLAFAIAAHLEPEILIVDEVLAVGDAQFQKKCMGKLKDISCSGRTVLFVSHNLNAINNLCEKGIELDKGRMVFYGSNQKAIQNYQTSNSLINREVVKSFKFNKDKAINITAINIKVVKEGVVGSVGFCEDFYIEVQYVVNFLIDKWCLRIFLKNSLGEYIFASWDTDSIEFKVVKPGRRYVCTCKIPGGWFIPGDYSFDVGVYDITNQIVVENHEEIQKIEINNLGYNKNNGRVGVIAPTFQWRNHPLAT